MAIGDTFAERFLWAGTPLIDEPGVPETPYVSPDELRTRAFSKTFIEVSGTPLHKRIYEEFLGVFGYGGTSGVTFESVPSEDDVAEALAQAAHPDLWKLNRPSNKELRAHLTETMKSSSFPLDGSRSPFPVFLHELKPFPIDGKKHRIGSATKPEDSVWRIFQSHGEVRDERDGDDAMKSIVDKTKTWLEQNIANLTCPTVFVVCDRNTTKGASKSAIRSSLDSATIESLRSLTRGPTGSDQAKKSLVLWHTRVPFHKENGIGQWLTQADYRRRRVIPIVNAQCLREAGVPLRFDVAFETTMRQIVASKNNDVIAFLLKFPHSLIRFDYGVIHMSAVGEKLSGLDIHAFNAGPQTDQANRNGIVAGMTPLLIASILRELAQFAIGWRGKPEEVVDGFLSACEATLYPSIRHNTPLDRAIDLGLICGQKHFARGYGQTSNLPFESGSSKKAFVEIANEIVNVCPSLKLNKMPTSGSAAHLYGIRGTAEIGNLTRCSLDPQCLAGDEVVSSKRLANFSRLSLFNDPGFLETVAGVPIEDYKKSDHGRFLNEDSDAALLRIVTHGLQYVMQRPSSVEGPVEPSIAIPYVTFGNYQTLNFAEIDEFLEVRHLVEKYVAQSNWTTPLAIAVFGKPGSGKSTIVREILSVIKGCRLERSLEVNVSQWTDLRNLVRQLHRIRDSALEYREEGEVPAAFFDEFDAQFEGKDVGWLRYFLMPLQDGMYMDGEDRFHVGKSIFILAGGVTTTYDSFKQRFGGLVNDKVPDFIGRLRAHVNISDLDMRDDYDPVKKLNIKVRRAVFLRNILAKNLPQIFDHNNVASIAPNVVMAMLNAERYEHGVRSMEAIVQMSRVPKGARSYQPSALPPPAQLEPHVSSAKFLDHFRG